MASESSAITKPLVLALIEELERLHDRDNTVRALLAELRDLLSK